MDCMLQRTNSPSKDTIDRVQECQTLLIAIQELSEQKEEHIKRLAVCEGILEERRRLFKTFNDRETETAEKMVRSMQVNLDEHRNLVKRHMNNIKNLQSAYSEVILGLLKNTDPGWLDHRRKTLLTAFYLAKDIHISIMQKSGDIVSPCKRTRRPVKRYRVGQRSRNR
ncbi:MAG: hypothetical protein Q9161_007552 [Pseudevernia consocians]